ncbi:uncharacterized protein LOC132717913 [Ruditapes philippinarum]|uniref:uncharacterized protein LOC132717913 n=1 Tax=Ruditapes philippinarum TaxID=129788 RepID=UPI00295B0C1C|nr:uncharacterized protein LOC132717913 [Ruditapes philippinarum]
MQEKLCLQMRAKDEKYHCLVATDSFTILEAQHFADDKAEVEDENNTSSDDHTENADVETEDVEAEDNETEDVEDEYTFDDDHSVCGNEAVRERKEGKKREENPLTDGVHRTNKMLKFQKNMSGH